MRHVEAGGQKTAGILASLRPGSLHMLDTMHRQPLDTVQRCICPLLDLILEKNGMEGVMIRQPSHGVQQHHHN